MVRGAWVLAALAGFTAPAGAVTVISRFDADLEGWTVEGPGTLEWISTGGSPGGYIRVTRTGPGEVYLIAPPSVQQFCLSPAPDLCLSVRADRIVARPLSVVIQTMDTAVSEAGEVPCSGCWSAWRPNPNATVGAFSSQTFFTAVRIRMGVDPSLPVGEMTEFDNIEWRTLPANCDGSTTPPTLNVNDFLCFMNAYAAQDPYANYCAIGSNGCAGGGVGVFSDFQAFLNIYAQAVGCP